MIEIYKFHSPGKEKVYRYDSLDSARRGAASLCPNPSKASEGYAECPVDGTGYILSGASFEDLWGTPCETCQASTFRAGGCCCRECEKECRDGRA